MTINQTDYKRLLLALEQMMDQNEDLSEGCKRMLRELSGLMCANIFFSMIDVEKGNMVTGEAVQNDVTTRLKDQNESLQVVMKKWDGDIAALKEEQKAAGSKKHDGFFKSFGKMLGRDFINDAYSFSLAVYMLIGSCTIGAALGLCNKPYWNDHLIDIHAFDEPKIPTDHTGSGSAVCASDQTEINRRNEEMQTETNTVLTPLVNTKTSINNVINNAIEGIKASSMSG